LSNISEHLVKRTATEAVARAALSQTPQQPDPTINAYENAPGFNGQYINAVAPNDHDSKVPPPNYLTVDPSMGPSTNVYAIASAFPYNNGTATTGAPYQARNNSFDQSSYVNVADTGMSAAHVAAIQSAASGDPPPPPENFIYANTTTPNNAPPHYPVHPSAHNDAWQQWARANVNPIGPPQEYSRPQEYNTANTLMALGGRDGGPPGAVQEGSVAAEGTSVSAQTASWPMMIFGIGPNGSMQPQ
jgi:hypothetical protein